MTGIRRILLAEDDPKDVELTLTALADCSLANEVVTVHDGAQVLEYLRATGDFAGRPNGHPVVVLLDLKMPKLDGIDVIREMRGDPGLRQIPIVVLTSSRENRDLETCYRLGVNAYVVKPVRFEEFVASISQLGVFWALINEPPPGSIARREG